VTALTLALRAVPLPEGEGEEPYESTLQKVRAERFLLLAGQRGFNLEPCHIDAGSHRDVTQRVELQVLDRTETPLTTLPFI
jgi:hypothetical protein